MTDSSDTSDRDYLIFNKGFVAGEEHSKSSIETITRFQHIEERLAEIVTLLGELTLIMKKKLN